MKKFVWLTLALSCAALLTACPSPNNEAAVLLEESNALGDNAYDDVEEYADTLGIFESAGAPVSVVNAIIRPQAADPLCRTISAGANTDTDSDNIPNDVTYSFNKANCTKQLAGGATFTRGGNKRLQDTDNTNNRSHSETLSGLESVWTRTLNGKNVVFTATRNGTRNITQGTNTTLTRVHDVNGTSVRTVDGNPGQGVVWRNQLSLVYTAGGNNTISNTAPLPDGTLNISGTWTSTRGTRPQRVFSVSGTNLGFSKESTCNAKRIVSGTLTLTDSKGTVTITFNGCNTAASVVFAPISN
jgi:hypothetical protein